MRVAAKSLSGSSRTRRIAARAVAAFVASRTLVALVACGGTTGHEGLPMPAPDVDSGFDATVVPDANTEPFDAGVFDVAIEYADRLLPEVLAPVSDSGSASDVAVDGAEAGLLPCTIQNPTNCVQCQGNIDGDGGTEAGLCTPTEADFVALDIANGIATAPGPDPEAPGAPPDQTDADGGPAGASDGAAPSAPNPAVPATGSCYYCLFFNGCLDDTQFGDMGNECEDGNYVGTGMTTVAECESVVQCMLNTACAAMAVVDCYCGDSGVSTGCQGNPAPVGNINGACKSQIASALGFPLTDGTEITKNFYDTTKAGGRADQILQCAQSNMCTACLQKK